MPRPSVAAVEDSDDFETLATRSIRCDVRRPWNHVLARPGHPARPAEIRKVCQTPDGGEDQDAGAVWFFMGSVSTKFSKVADRAR